MQRFSSQMLLHTTDQTLHLHRKKAFWKKPDISEVQAPFPHLQVQVALPWCFRRNETACRLLRRFRSPLCLRAGSRMSSPVLPPRALRQEKCMRIHGHPGRMQESCWHPYQAHALFLPVQFQALRRGNPLLRCHTCRLRALRSWLSLHLSLFLPAAGFRSEDRGSRPLLPYLPVWSAALWKGESGDLSHRIPDRYHPRR